MIAILHFCSFIVDSLLIVYIFGRGLDNRVNRLCLLLISSFAIWSLGYGLANLTHSQEEALLFFNIAAVGICAFPSIALWFYLTLIDHHRFRYRVIPLSITIVIPVFFLFEQWSGNILNAAINTSWGWAAMWSHSPFSYLYLAYLAIIIAVCAYLIIQFGINATTQWQTAQARMLVVSGCAAIVLGIALSIISQFSSLWAFPQLTDTVVVIWAIGIVYSISKFGLMSITPVAAAEKIVSIMSDCLMLLDANRNIVYLNKSAMSILGAQAGELKNTNFNSIVLNKWQADELIKETIAKGIGGRRELSYVSTEGMITPVLVSTSIIREPNHSVAGFVVSGVDITERKRIEEKLVDSNAVLKRTLDDAINALARIVEMRDPYTHGHQRRVTELAVAIGDEMGIDDDKLELLKMSAIVHDIGKISIPVEILCKPGKLNSLEFEILKTHPQNGYDIVRSMNLPESFSQTVLQHHERLNGSGYPHGLKNGQILPEAKIMAVADTVEAMVSDRPYRPALGIDRAMEEIYHNRGRLYEPDVVNACLALFDKGGFQFK